MEEETLSFYSAVRKTNHQNEKYYYYECSRSGTYRPKGKGIRRLKSQKSSKIGNKCPAKINLKITATSLIVKFYEVHDGHDKDLEHLRLSSNFRAAVAVKLKEGVPAKRVVEDMRSEAIKANNIGRAALVNLKDVQNIKRDFNVEHHKHKVDAVSVKLWVDEMAEQRIEIASVGNTLKKDEILANIQCLPEISTLKNKKTSLADKLHTLTEMYNSSSITEEEEEDLHKRIDGCLAVFSERRPKEVVKTNYRKVEPQCSLFSTKKKRKNNKLIQNPTWRETKFIKKHLQDCNEPMTIHTEFDHTY